MKHIGSWAAATAALFLILDSRDIPAQTDGYLSARSVAQGENLRFYISTPLATFDATIYKLGLFKKQMTVLHDLPGGIQQTGDSAFIDGCRWNVTKGFQIPSYWPAGIYEADIPSADSVKKLVFVIRPKLPGNSSKT